MSDSLDPISSSGHSSYVMKIKWELLNIQQCKSSILKETYYVSTTEPNRLMLFGETVAVYCENYTKHTDTVRTSQEAQYISNLQPGTLTTRPQRRSTFFYITYINSVRTSQET
jgi:hypothetical protein